MRPLSWLSRWRTRLSLFDGSALPRHLGLVAFIVSIEGLRKKERVQREPANKRDQQTHKPDTITTTRANPAHPPGHTHTHARARARTRARTARQSPPPRFVAAWRRWLAIQMGLNAWARHGDRVQAISRKTCTSKPTQPPHPKAIPSHTAPSQRHKAQVPRKPVDKHPGSCVRQPQDQTEAQTDGQTGLPIDRQI